MPPKAAPPASLSTRKPAASSTTSGDQNTAPQNSTYNASEAPSNPPSGRAPVQRLQSLNKRTPGGSIGSRASIGLDDPNQPKPVLKFKPRAASRRTKEEREAMLKLEEERNRQRLAEAAEIQRSRMGRAPRARGGALRGRGGGFVSNAGVPMGAGAAKRGRGGRFEPDSRASSVSKRGVSRVSGATPRGWGSDSSESEDDHAFGTNIDQINLDVNVEDEDDVVTDKKGKKPVKYSSRSSVRGPLPIRVLRHEHEERVIVVNTEASSSTSAELRRQAKEKEKADADDSLFVEETDGNEQSLKIKSEPTEGDVSMADLPPAHAETVEDDDGETPLPAQVAKARKKVAIKDPRSLLRTKEDIEEFDRHLEDLEVMKEILTLEEKPAATAVKAKEAADAEIEGAAEPKESAEEEDILMEKNAGKLFLIQFPPLTPNLVVPGANEQTEVDQNNASDDVTFTHSNTRQGEPEVKREEGEDTEKPEVNFASDLSRKIVTATQRVLPAGRVGRLNCHKSGRVTLDWGGITFELSRGADVNFVQEALIASTPPSALAGEEEVSGEKRVWAMGQLSGKFVASPEWNQLL